MEQMHDKHISTTQVFIIHNNEVRVTNSFSNNTLKLL